MVGRRAGGLLGSMTVMVCGLKRTNEEKNHEFRKTLCDQVYVVNLDGSQ